MCFPLFKKSFTLASEVSIEDYDNGDDNNDNNDNDSDTNLGEDIRKLDYGQHVERKRTLRTRGIKMLELEEADKRRQWLAAYGDIGKERLCFPRCPRTSSMGARAAR